MFSFHPEPTQLCEGSIPGNVIPKPMQSVEESFPGNHQEMPLVVRHDTR